MPYSKFNLPAVIRQFGLEMRDKDPLVLEYDPIEASPVLLGMLELGSQIAVAQGSGKARSEFIIAPILLEVRRIVDNQIAVFSGIDFPVDKTLGLIGACDFLLAKSGQNHFLESPVVTVVEAKNENFKQGIAQAAAEMVAALIFNERDGKPQPRVWGAVTIGNQWQFLCLENKILTVDNHFYDLEELPSILGILVAMLR